MISIKKDQKGSEYHCLYRTLIYSWKHLTDARIWMKFKPLWMISSHIKNCITESILCSIPDQFHRKMLMRPSNRSNSTSRKEKPVKNTGIKPSRPHPSLPLGVLSHLSSFLFPLSSDSKYFQFLCFICRKSLFFLKSQVGLHEKFPKKTKKAVASRQSRKYCISGSNSDLPCFK